jgi:hypothetical protein
MGLESNGQPLNTDRYDREIEEIYDQAKSILTTLVKTGKYRPNSFKGCPGSRRREAWLAEIA